MPKGIYKRTPTSPIRRFLNKVKHLENGCAVWMGARRASGYGIFTQHSTGNGGRSHVRWYAHRFSFTAFVGDIPDGLYVCHSCDNPSCVNPEHLWIGTAKDNAWDSIEKGRHIPPPVFNWPERMKTKKHHWATLEVEEVKSIKRRLSNGTETQSSIASDYGVSTDTVGKIFRGERWTHVEI